MHNTKGEGISEKLVNTLVSYLNAEGEKVVDVFKFEEALQAMEEEGVALTDREKDIVNSVCFCENCSL